MVQLAINKELTSGYGKVEQRTGADQLKYVYMLRGYSNCALLVVLKQFEK